MLNQKAQQQQRQVFSQHLAQSLKILELPLLELKTLVDAEIVENPVIEEQAPAQTELPQTPAEQTTEDNLRQSEDDDADFFERNNFPQELNNFEKPLPGRKETLSDVLLKQLRINCPRDEEIKVGLVIINNLDENGYLRESLEILMAREKCSLDLGQKVLAVIQTFEPYGVAARDLRECLLLQLKKKAADPLVERIICDFLNDLAEKNYGRIIKKLKCGQDEFFKAVEKIHRLEPKPGRQFTQDEVPYVIPDIVIEEKDGDLLIIPKNDTVPQIRVNAIYKTMLRSKETDEKTKEFLRQKMQNASNLIRAIQQRQTTLQKVITAIAEHQKEAIQEGMDRIKPLSIKDIAERVHMSESTISRVVMNKYVQTQHGVFALKDFFSTAFQTSDGKNVSAQTIKLKIQELIQQENKSRPLTDEKIAEIITSTENIPIARRTIAKYRESLKIDPASRRRQRLSPTTH